MGALTQAILPEVNKTRIEELDKDVTGLKKIVEGDNGEGLKGKVSKLQDRVELMLKVMWMTFAGVVSLLLATIWDRVF